MVQGSLLNVVWQLGWEGSLEENGYVYIYMTESLHCSLKLSYTVNQLYTNTKYKV